MGQAAHRVILVDCDLRRPKQHRIFSSRNEIGLADFLSNRAQLSHIIQEDDLVNISLITSGTLSVDQHPAELLASERISDGFLQTTRASDFATVGDL